MYDDIKYFGDLVKQYENVIKINNCKYVNVCIPNFQNEILEVLASHEFIDYKVEFEKELK